MVQAQDVQQQKRRRRGLLSPTETRYCLDSAAATQQPATTAGLGATTIERCHVDEAVSEGSPPDTTRGPPETSAKRELPSRSARGKGRGPDPLAVDSKEYNRVQRLRSDKAGQPDEPPTAGATVPQPASSRKQAALSVRFGQLAGSRGSVPTLTAEASLTADLEKQAAAHGLAVQQCPAILTAGIGGSRGVPLAPHPGPKSAAGTSRPHFGPAAGSSDDPKGLARRQAAKAVHAGRGHKVRQKGGTQAMPAGRNVAVQQGRVEEPLLMVPADAVAAFACVSIGDTVKGRPRKSAVSSTTLGLTGGAHDVAGAQHKQAIKEGGGDHRRQKHVAAQGVKPGSQNLAKRPASPLARTAAVRSLPGGGTRGGTQLPVEAQPGSQDHAQQTRKRRQGDEPPEPRMKGRRAATACRVLQSSAPMHTGTLAPAAAAAAASAQPTVRDRVESRKRSAPQRLQAVPSKEYNLWLAAQAQ